MLCHKFRWYRKLFIYFFKSILILTKKFSVFVFLVLQIMFMVLTSTPFCGGGSIAKFQWQWLQHSLWQRYWEGFPHTDGTPQCNSAPHADSTFPAALPMQMARHSPRQRCSPCRQCRHSFLCRLCWMHFSCTWCYPSCSALHVDSTPHADFFDGAPSCDGASPPGKSIDGAPPPRGILAIVHFKQ